MADVKVKYLGVPYQLVTEVRGHTIKSDAVDLRKNGGNTGATPHEQLLGALGGCVLMTILMYVLRRSLPVETIEVTVIEGKIDSPQNSGKKIPHVNFKVDVKGDKLTEADIAKIKEIGEKCPLKKWVQEDKVLELDVTHVVPVSTDAAAQAEAPAEAADSSASAVTVTSVPNDTGDQSSSQ